MKGIRELSEIDYAGAQFSAPLRAVGWPRGPASFFILSWRRAILTSFRSFNRRGGRHPSRRKASGNTLREFFRWIIYSGRAMIKIRKIALAIFRVAGTL